MTERDIDDRVASFLADTRTKSDITQTEMAKKLNMSRRTIQSWENAESSPKLSKIIQWLHITKQSPIQVLQEIAAPELSVQSKDSGDHAIDKAVDTRIASLRPNEKRGLLFVLLGKHGSSVYAFLQLCIAYLQCPMGDRQSITLTVINNYKLAKEMGTLVCPDDVQPDMEALELAYENGRKAYINRQNSYFNVDYK